MPKSPRALITLTAAHIALSTHYTNHRSPRARNDTSANDTSANDTNDYFHYANESQVTPSSYNLRAFLESRATRGTTAERVTGGTEAGELGLDYMKMPGRCHGVYLAAE